MSERKSKVVKRAVAWSAGVTLLAIFLLSWTHSTEEEDRYTPDYPMEDISGLLQKEQLTEEDYQVLYRQTGLSPLAVDALRAEGREEELLDLQERFFAEVVVCCEQEFFLFNEVLELPGEQEALPAKAAGRVEAVENTEATENFMPVLENGDILITFNSHFLGWRNGHAAIVVDAEKGKTLEALSLGTDSAILSIKSWNDCPSFAVLRLTAASAEQRDAIAEYAEKNLAEQPYRLTAGIFGENRKDEWTFFSGTNCSHLVWQAYMEYGYDLDSDGGIIVTPKDLYESPLLELVQVYGMKPTAK